MPEIPDDVATQEQLAAQASDFWQGGSGAAVGWSYAQYTWNVNIPSTMANLIDWTNGFNSIAAGGITVE